MDGELIVRRASKNQSLSKGDFDDIEEWEDYLNGERYWMDPHD